MMRRVGTALALVLLMTLAGCASIPTSGPVEVAPGFQDEPEAGVQVAPEPPQPNSSPRTVVEGFLQAMANYQPGYQVARQYLAEDVAESWRPESQVLIYADGYSVATTPDSATLTAPLYGRIAADGSFSRMQRTLKLDFGLERNAEGEWRISRPPDGVVMTQYTFENFYSSVNTYFFDPTFARLVPDQIFLPRNNRTPTTLLQALLRGPTTWLDPAVETAVPPQTRLNVQSASLADDGVVEISLTDQVLGLDDERRTYLITQMLMTLRQLPEVTGLRITVNGEPYPVPQQDERGVVPVTVATSLAPEGPRSEQVFGLSRDGVVEVVDGPNDSAMLPVTGPLARQPAASSLAVSQDATQGAVVSQDDTSLVVAPFTGERSTVLVNDNTDLLRPDFVGTATPELWFVGVRDGHQQVGMWDGTQTQRVDTDIIGNARIVNFAIAPDGVRFAAVRELASGQREVGFGLIDRADARPVLSGWRSLTLSEAGQTPDLRPVDIGWTSDTDVAVLVVDRAQEEGGKDDAGSRVLRVDQSGSRVSDVGQPEDWRVRALASQPTDGVRVTVVGDGAWEFQDNLRWTRMNADLRAVAYPG